MADRQVLQVVLSGEQRDVIDLVLSVTNTKISTLIRRLLLEWAAAAVDFPGTVRGGRCGARHSDCIDTPATWYSAPGRIFVCEPCARKTITICAPAVDANHPAINIEKLRAAIKESLKHQVEKQTHKSDDELLSDLLGAAATLAERREQSRKELEAKVEAKTAATAAKAANFADLFARF